MHRRPTSSPGRASNLAALDRTVLSAAYGGGSGGGLTVVDEEEGEWKCPKMDGFPLGPRQKKEGGSLVVGHTAAEQLSSCCVSVMQKSFVVFPEIPPQFGQQLILSLWFVV